jgi:hypothetical protein
MITAWQRVWAYHRQRCTTRFADSLQWFPSRNSGKLCVAEHTTGIRYQERLKLWHLESRRSV